MEAIFVIQDISNKEYYWRWGIDEGFIIDINEAKIFGNEEEALKELNEDYLSEIFSERIIEIKKYYRN